MTWRRTHESNASDRIRKSEDGFTLIEIMVVILIIGLLATIVVQNLRGATDKAKRVKAQADIAEIKTGLDRYYLDNGSYPTSDQGLSVLVARPSTGNVRPTTRRAAISKRSHLIPGAIHTFIRATVTPTC